MNLQEELTQLFHQKSCTVEWLEDLSDNLWDFNTKTFFEDDMGKFLGPKPAIDIIIEIFSHELKLDKRHFTLMLHKLPEECVPRNDSNDFNNTPVYMLYYNYA